LVFLFEHFSKVFYDQQSEDRKSEGAIDDGGPTREYLQLVMKEMLKLPIFCEADDGESLTMCRSVVGQYYFRAVV